MRIKGFTLIEMLTVIAVGAVILSLVSVFLIESLRTWQREEREFSSWQSGERFMRDFRRDLRRALPASAGYRGEVFELEFSGDLLEIEGDPPRFISHSALYYMAEEKNRGAVREIYVADRLFSARNYPGVESFSVERSREYPSLFELKVKISRMDEPLSQAVLAPAEAGAPR